MSQINEPIPSAKTAFIFTLATSAIIGVAVVIANRNKNEPGQSTKKYGYTVRGNNYSNCNCEK